MDNPTTVVQLISPSGFYGAERWVLALARNLDRCRTRLIIVVTSEDPNERIELLEHIPNEISSFRVEMKNRFDISVVLRIAELVNENNVQIIHAHGYKSDLIGLLAAKVANVQCVSTPHGYNKQVSPKLQFYFKISAWFLRFFDYVVPLSPSLMNEVVEMGGSRRNLVLIENGVDLSEVLNLQEEKEKRNQLEIRSIGVVGQLIERKRVEHILNAFDLLWRDHPELTLTIIGDGAMRKDLEKCATELSSSCNIRFLGFRKDRLKHMAKLDLFVMASSQEGIPRSMMEAMALEVPVVAYSIPGVDMLIEKDEETGFIATENSPDGLYEACKRAIDNPALARDVGQRGRSHIVNHYSAERMANEYSDLFEKMVQT